MSQLGVEGITAIHREDLRPLFAQLTDAEWAAPSACAGWRTQDVLAHVVSNQAILVDPPPVPEHEPGHQPGAEQMAELLIDPYRMSSPAELLERYDAYLEPWLAVLEAMQEEPVASSPAGLGELGTHPTAIFPDIYCFDHSCHHRHDLLAPLGSIERAAPPPTESRLRPAIDWMMAGLPWMCPELTGVLTAPVRVVIEGVGGGTWTWLPVDETERIVVVGGEPVEGSATVVSSAGDFIGWGTQRWSWRDSCRVEGDGALATAVLDVVNVI